MPWAPTRATACGRTPTSCPATPTSTTRRCSSRGCRVTSPPRTTSTAPCRICSTTRRASVRTRSEPGRASERLGHVAAQPRERLDEGAPDDDAEVQVGARALAGVADAPDDVAAGDRRADGGGGSAHEVCVAGEHGLPVDLALEHDVAAPPRHGARHDDAIGDGVHGRAVAGGEIDARVLRRAAGARRGAVAEVAR